MMFNPLLLLLMVSLMFNGILTFFYTREVESHAEFRATVEAAQKQAQRDAERHLFVSEQIAKDTATGWAAALDYSRANPVVRVLRKPSCDRYSLRAVPPTPGITAQLPVSEPGLSPPRDVAQEECEARIQAAVNDAAYIEHVKAWVESQHEASK